MTHKILKPFTVSYECYSDYDCTTIENPICIKAVGKITILANDILEAINLANGKLTGFVGNSFEILDVTKGYDIPIKQISNRPYYPRHHEDEF